MGNQRSMLCTVIDVISQKDKISLNKYIPDSSVANILKWPTLNRNGFNHFIK